MKVYHAKWVAACSIVLFVAVCWANYDEILDPREGLAGLFPVAYAVLALLNGLVAVQAWLLPAIWIEGDRVFSRSLGSLVPKSLPLNSANIDTDANGKRTMFFRPDGRLQEFFVSETSPFFVRKQVQKLLDRLSAKLGNERVSHPHKTR